MDVASWSSSHSHVSNKLNNRDIFCDILPAKLLYGRFHQSFKEVELYDVQVSPQQLLDCYGNGNDELYCFTVLKRKSRKRYNRVVGRQLGAWDRRTNTPCSLEVDQLLMTVGEIRFFHFKYQPGKEDKGESDILWTMHEYALDERYVNYLFKKHNLDPPPHHLIQRVSIIHQLLISFLI